MAQAVEKGWRDGALLLAVDTCGATGSVALGQVEAGQRNAGQPNAGQIVLLGEAALAGGEFAARLLPAIAEVLATASATVSDLSGITVVAGPGSFTGIRIGLAAVKAIAEAAALPVVTVSRLALLAHAAQTHCAVLDAHRGQFFCGFFEAGEGSREFLVTAGEINAAGGLRGPVGVCEESVAQLLEELQGEPELVRVPPPSAAAALAFSADHWQAGDFADVATLDGHYLRGADAKVSARLSQ